MLDIRAGHPTRRPLAKAFAAILNACRAVAEHRRRRRAAADLCRLDDRLLRDIGLARADVMAAGPVPRRGERP